MRLGDIVGPGSIPWLMRHDILLGYRNMRASSRRAGRVALSILGVLVILLHVVGFFAAPDLAAMHREFQAESMMVGFVVLVSVFALFIEKLRSGNSVLSAAMLSIVGRAERSRKEQGDIHAVHLFR